ncbi:small permease of tripartite tricarboxylate transporter [Massilia eurypsychrophila]|uniref:Small permease of tripartite tricarboxylate transporter n=1 Tax=Massilia eurypsychrophila TaxID=1485217 RepID=A0A2G8T8T0_9BURK|nr:tripartite tricarboxylate transporter TctB family protein [Massilia eurypsychrophila]PIL42451.1 small permease of tripartite tricarboxylate transporter [Massilia eurypsychrophila]
MPSFIRHPKDFWTGIIFLFFGLGAVFIGQDYAMGSAGRMGPAYFPSVLGTLLAVIGLIGIIRSFILVGEPIGRFYMKELLMILAAILLFGILMRGAGLVPAILVLIFLSAYAGPKFNLKEVTFLAVGLAVFAVVVFVKLLGLPMAAFGPWFGV